MTLAHSDARSWARARSASDAPRLGMLEAYAFQAHPEAVATFGADGEAVAALLGRKSAPPLRRAVTWAVGLFAVIGLLAPVAGLAVLVRGPVFYLDRAPADQSIPVSAVLFAIAAAAVVVAAIVWWAQGAFWSGLACGAGVVAAGCAAFASINMPTISQRDGYELPVLEQVPVWATLVLGLVFAGAVGLRRRVRVPDAPEPAAAAPLTASVRARAEAAVSAIPAAERAKSLADRDEALRIIAERGLIDDDLLHRALRAAPGTLFTLDGSGKDTP